MTLTRHRDHPAYVAAAAGASVFNLLIIILQLCSSMIIDINHLSATMYLLRLCWNFLVAPRMGFRAVVDTEILSQPAQGFFLL
jgi:hypothetical protein